MNRLILTGAPRSGTSLLHSLLNENDNINMQFEKSYWKLDITILNDITYISQILSSNKNMRKEGLSNIKFRKLIPSYYPLLFL